MKKTIVSHNVKLVVAIRSISDPTVLDFDSLEDAQSEANFYKNLGYNVLQIDESVTYNDGSVSTLTYFV